MIVLTFFFKFQNLWINVEKIVIRDSQSHWQRRKIKYGLKMVTTCTSMSQKVGQNSKSLAEKRLKQITYLFNVDLSHSIVTMQSVV